MKLFGIEITRTKMAEKFKGFFDTGYGAKPTRKHFYLGEHSWLDRCTKFDRLCEAHPLAKQTLQALGGQVIANGIYVQPTEDYARAKEAAEIIEKYSKLFPNIVYHFIHGIICGHSCRAILQFLNLIKCKR